MSYIVGSYSSSSAFARSISVLLRTLSAAFCTLRPFRILWWKVRSLLATCSYKAVQVSTLFLKRRKNSATGMAKILASLLLQVTVPRWSLSCMASSSPKTEPLVIIAKLTCLTAFLGEPPAVGLCFISNLFSAFFGGFVLVNSN